MIDKMSTLLGGYTVIITTTKIQQRCHKKNVSIKSGLSGMGILPVISRNMGKRLLIRSIKPCI